MDHMPRSPDPTTVSAQILGPWVPVTAPRILLEVPPANIKMLRGLQA